MSIDAEMIAAFADGELSPIEAARVARAIAADPALAAQVETHRSLRETLAGHYAPIAAEPVPDRLSAFLKADEHVVDLAQARAERTRRTRLPVWTSSAIAASLVLGVGIGTQLPEKSTIGTRDGAMVAQGTLDRALTTQLAAAQNDAPFRILVSFKERGGSVCRGFDSADIAGIACRTGDDWALRRIQSSRAFQNTGYRQANSSASDILSAAQDMADASAFDAAQEQAARANGWQAP